MTSESFEALVKRLEVQARSNPAAYRTRVLLTALLGNVYLGCMLALIGALLAAAVVSIVWLKAAGVKIAFLIAVFLWVVLKALWLKMEPPEGTEVTAADAPELFAMIEELRRALRSPPFHHVLITDEFNAAVIQAPRLGIFGWCRNYLLIGLPLAKALTLEQFKAVLAHEFGHLAKGHGRTSNWIYRQRLRWSRLMATLEASDSFGLFLFRPFLRWYTPYFNAYSYPLARANEFEADATAGRLVSRKALAEALSSVNVVDSYLEERFWPQVHRRAAEMPHPAFSPYSGLGYRVAAEIDEASRRSWLEQALARETTLDDTHPSLSERLAALDEKPRLGLPPPGAAADRLLGRTLGRITQEFDRRWQDRILPYWQERHREVQEGRRRLAELDDKHLCGKELSLQEAYDRAILTESCSGNPQACVEQLRSLHARAPEDREVLHALGTRLLARDDAAGRPLLLRAMERDEAEIVRCCQALRDHCWRNGLKDEAQGWHRRMVERAQLERAAKEERDHVRATDRFERHGMDAESLARLQAQLKAIPGLRKAYFVRKRVQHMPERACYVLGFTVHGWLPWGKRGSSELTMRRIQETVTFPGETTILSVEGANYRFGRKFRFMRGSRIV